MSEFIEVTHGREKCYVNVDFISYVRDMDTYSEIHLQSTTGVEYIPCHQLFDEIVAKINEAKSYKK